MANNWAIAIGINQYQFFQPLSYAQADARTLLDFLVQSAGFSPQHCLLLTDASPPVGGQSTYPNRENMLCLLDSLISDRLQPGDQLWCFFSGYGVNYKKQDYLMPVEGNSNRVVETGISVRSLYKSLQAAAAETVLLLDINRASGTQTDALVGRETIELARELQVPTILSCLPDQFSRESAELGHSFFTAALLEALRSGQCPTLVALERYLNYRLPQLCDHHSRPPQQPLAVIQPLEKSHQLILPQLATAGTWNSHRSEPAAASTQNQSLPPQVQPLATTQTPGQSQSAAESSALIPATSRNSAEAAPRTTQKQQLLWWGAGSLLVLALTLGVILRHWTAFGGGQQAALQSLRATTTTTSESAPATSKSQQHQEPNRVLLDRARMSLGHSQASDFSRAIKTVNKIRPGQPLYKQAQQDIDRWSRTIFDLAEGRAQRGDYEGAIAAAALLTKGQAVYPEAQTVMSQWRVAAKQQRSNQTLVQAANGLIRPNQASSYNRALEVASKVPSGQPGSALAQQSIRRWSQTILALSEQRAANGKFNDAVQTAVLVPEYAPAYPQARQAIRKWQKQLKSQQ